MGNFCNNCGQELGEGQVVCPNCGASVANNGATSVADSKAKTGFILGLVSIIAWLIPLFGYPVTICGIVWSVRGLPSQQNHGKAIAGLVLSIVFLILTLFNSILGALMQVGVIKI